MDIAARHGRGSRGRRCGARVGKQARQFHRPLERDSQDVFTVDIAAILDVDEARKRGHTKMRRRSE